MPFEQPLVVRTIINLPTGQQQLGLLLMPREILPHMTLDTVNVGQPRQWIIVRIKT